MDSLPEGSLELSKPKEKMDWEKCWLYALLSDSSTLEDAIKLHKLRFELG